MNAELRNSQAPFKAGWEWRAAVNPLVYQTLLNAVVWKVARLLLLFCPSFAPAGDACPVLPWPVWLRPCFVCLPLVNISTFARGSKGMVSWHQPEVSA
jgi:hypothetical protein